MSKEMIYLNTLFYLIYFFISSSLFLLLYVINLSTVSSVLRQMDRLGSEKTQRHRFRENYQYGFLSHSRFPV